MSVTVRDVSHLVRFDPNDDRLWHKWFARRPVFIGRGGWRIRWLCTVWRKWDDSPWTRPHEHGWFYRTLRDGPRVMAPWDLP